MSTVAKVDVVGVGLNATDTVIFLPTFPDCGAKVEFGSAQTFLGGQVATAMVACQRWGLRTRYVGKLGDDQAAKAHGEEFERTGIEARVALARDCASQQAFILVEKEGERTVLWRRDENLALRPEELDREWIVNARILHLDGYDTAAAIRAADWARVAGIPVVADIDDVYVGVENLLEKVDYLVISRDFPVRVTREPDLRDSLPLLQKRYGCRLTAATLGTDGVLAWDGSGFHYARAYRVSVVDTTGAGDVFHAGFIYGLLQEWPLQRQLEFACAAAALNCTGAGARGGIQALGEIEDLRANGALYPAAYHFITKP